MRTKRQIILDSLFGTVGLILIAIGAGYFWGWATTAIVLGVYLIANSLCPWPKD